MPNPSIGQIKKWLKDKQDLAKSELCGTDLGRGVLEVEQIVKEIVVMRLVDEILEYMNSDV